jgi:hypothetical protein
VKQWDLAFVDMAPIAQKAVPMPCGRWLRTSETLHCDSQRLYNAAIHKAVEEANAAAPFQTET